MVVVPAAIAWACNPQAHIQVDKTSFTPGSTGTIYGSYFPSGAAITVSTPTGPKSVTASSGGAWSVGFTVPSKPGTYVLSATRPTGGQASTTFTVAAKTVARAPATAPNQGGSGVAPRAPSFDGPSVVRSQREESAAGTGGNDGGPGAQTSPGGNGSGPGSGVVSQGGGLVFAGSAPAAAPGTFSTAPSTAAAGSPQAERSGGSASPSEQAATGYAWSGFAPGRTASLNSAGDMVSEDDTGSGLGLGIGLLAFGLVALVAGLTAAEVSRRRSAA